MRILNGIVPVLITPLDVNQVIDGKCLERLLSYYLEKKVGGLWVLGTGGEDMCLSMNQRLELADKVCGIVSGEVPVLLGCSFFSPADSFDFIDKSKHLNFDAYHAMPYHQKVSLKNIKSWYELLAHKTVENQKSIWAYTSGNWAQRMLPEFVGSLKEIDGITGVKYSSSNMVDVQGAIALADDDFQVITAVVKTLYSCLCLGAKAATSVEAAVFYDQISEVFKKFTSGKTEEAYRAQIKLNTEFLSYPSEAAKDNFLRISELKYMASKHGYCKEWVTPYYRQLNNEEKKALDIFCEKTSG